MRYKFGDYIISDERSLLVPEKIEFLLKQTTWAKDRPMEIIKKTMDTSLYIGAYTEDYQMLGFARCITDYAVFYYLCDVIVDEPYRGRGLGKALVEAVCNHEDLKTLSSILITRDAQGLYSRYGWETPDITFMRRVPPKVE